MTERWDAAAYDRVAAPMTRWGADVVARLPLRGDERVLDAGCGTGRVTEMLLERSPSGHVVALDWSEDMLAEARRRLDRFGDRVSYVRADLAEPLPVAPVDALLSTPTFHWVMDHDALWRHLAAVIRPGGRLVAQCGGTGNIRNVLDALDAVGDGWHGIFRFETPEATAARLEASGFRDVRCWLTDEPTVLEAGDSFETYLETVCLRQHVARLPAPDRRPFIRRVAERLPDRRIDYVRLNIDAIRAA